MTWRDKRGPVFRKSPDSAWPLACDNGGLPKGEDAPQSAAECEASQSGSAPAEIAHIHNVVELKKSRKS